MKGTFFDNNFEYSLQIDGESWKQGEIIKGFLNIKNLSSKELDVTKVGCFLTLGKTKKIKEKKADAYTLIDKVQFKSLTNTVAAKAEQKLPFEFQLKKDCPISEKISSLHILCGTEESKIDIGSLRLTVVPSKIITDFLEIFENFFKFKVKTLKSKNNFIEVTFGVPNSKEFTGVEQFKLLTRIDDLNLILNYQFKVKKLDFSNQSTKVKDHNLNFDEVLTPKQYHIYGDAINQEELVKHIDSILGNIRIKSMI